MDNQNTKMRAGEWLSSLIVLILVLMDNQNTRYHRLESRPHRVLILVLMDNQNTWNTLALGGLLCCLNPCSNG